MLQLNLRTSDRYDQFQQDIIVGTNKKWWLDLAIDPNFLKLTFSPLKMVLSNRNLHVKNQGGYSINLAVKKWMVGASRDPYPVFVLSRFRFQKTHLQKGSGFATTVFVP